MIFPDTYRPATRLPRPVSLVPPLPPLRSSADQDQ